MPIDWIKSHPGYAVFAALWIVALALRQVLDERASRPRLPLPAWIATLLTLAGGAVLLTGIRGGLAATLGYAFDFRRFLRRSQVAVAAAAGARMVPRKETDAREALLHTEQKLHLHIEQTPLGRHGAGPRGPPHGVEQRRGANFRFPARGGAREGFSAFDHPGIGPQRRPDDVGAAAQGRLGARADARERDPGRAADPVRVEQHPDPGFERADHRHLIALRGHYREASRGAGDREPRGLPPVQSEPGDAILRGGGAGLFQ